MKKNLILYILLVFLVVVNGFFLYHYMGGGANHKQRRPQRPTDFIAQELDFTPAQLEQLRESSQAHDKVMTKLSEDIRYLKDTLFNRLADASVDEDAIDSITSLLGQKEKEKRTKVFYHFKEIQRICDEKQREEFDRIINDALHNRGKKDQDLPGLEGADERRPPPSPKE